MSQHNLEPTEPAEPALKIGAIATAVGAVLALLTEFGVDLTEGQTNAILKVVLLGGPLLIAVLIRRKVYSPQSVAEMFGRVEQRPEDLR